MYHDTNEIHVQILIHIIAIDIVITGGIKSPRIWNIS